MIIYFVRYNPTIFRTGVADQCKIDRRPLFLTFCWVVVGGTPTLN
jgi:hypothetical protein